MCQAKNLTQGMSVLSVLSTQKLTITSVESMSKLECFEYEIKIANNHTFFIKPFGSKISILVGDSYY